MGKPPIEIEMKLVARDAKALAGLPEALRALGADVLRADRHVIRDRYYDTEDWRFYRANYALRIRRAKGKTILTMKSLDRPKGGVSRREELEQALPKGWRSFGRLPKGAVSDRVRRIADGDALRVLFAIRNRRTVYECRLGDSLTVLAGADDFRIEAVGKVELLAEVELEMTSGEVRELREFGRRLARRLGLSRAHRSKFKQGLDLAGLRPPAASRGRA
jgi:inorganic triphosphatase YgiF